MLTPEPGVILGAQPPIPASVTTKAESSEMGTSPEGEPPSKKKKRADSQPASQPPSQAALTAKSEPAEAKVPEIGPAGEPPSTKKKKRAEQLPKPQEPEAVSQEARAAEETCNSLSDAAKRKKKRKASLPVDEVEPEIKAEPLVAEPLPGEVSSPPPPPLSPTPHQNYSLSCDLWQFLYLPMPLSHPPILSSRKNDLVTVAHGCS